MLIPRARYRIYGGVGLYPRFLRDFLAGEHRRDDAVTGIEAELSTRMGGGEVVLAPLARVAIYDLVRYFTAPGDLVLLSPYTIVDVVNMVLAAGARPHFIDVEPHTGNICPASLKARLPRRARLILATHLHGIPADLPALLDVAQAAGLPLVEDAAQCLGARIESRLVGTFGHAGVFSFGSYKNVNAHFGGAVVTRDARLADFLREARAARPLFAARHLWRKILESARTDALGAHPMFGVLLHPLFRQAFLHDVEAINRLLRIELDTRARASVPRYMLARPTNLQVSALRAQWPDIERHTAFRIEAARTYARGLEAVPGLMLPPAPERQRNVYTYYPLQVRGAAAEVRVRRHSLLRALARGRRDVGAQHLHNVAELPDFCTYGPPCPEASRVAGALVLLPTYPGYDVVQQEANVEVIRRWARDPPASRAALT